MSIKDSPGLRIVLHEGEGSRALDGERRFELLRELLARGHAVSLGGPAGQGSGAAAGADGATGLLVLRETEDGTAKESGFPEDLFDGTPPKDVKVELRDVRETDAATVAGWADEFQKETAAYRNDGWKPWFPVIDYDRCTNCMQCLSFCLFDVYGVDASSRIEVRNEEKCKTNCPACSRVCPEVAILFPKYGSGPINGDVVRQDDVDREKMKVDVSALLGGDIYSMLRDRHERAASRFSKERDEGKALKERMRCLKKMKEDLDIPEEVLMSLPSHEAIRSKAEALAAGRGDGENGSGALPLAEEPNERGEDRRGE